MQTTKTATRDRLELIERSLLGAALVAATTWAALGDALGTML